ncbi:hypothetical protein, partial [Agrobacterium rubi]|uniref:hypothetical protein n=1 Tax=Agrobacterium rubi TaxID=28099 RepID=UPI001AEC4325
PPAAREEDDTGFGPAGVILPMPDLAASRMPRLTVLVTRDASARRLVAGCTDSSSSSGRTRLWGLKRKSGGTQEHAASAPHCWKTARTDRKGHTWPGLAGEELAKNGSILPPLDYRRGGKSKADAAELAGR